MYSKRSSAVHRARVRQMKTRRSTESHHVSDQTFGSFRSCLVESIRYWELRRLIYNFALFTVCVGWFVVAWPHFRPALAWSSLPPLVVLSLLANVCYCAAYLVDIPLQQLSFSAVWRRRRWVLWLMGTLFAIILASYWINDEIYPSIH